MSNSYVIDDQPVPGAGYRLVKFLGRGGFGEVWKVTAPGGAEAAMKIIRLGSREGRKELRALQLVKKIHHTHLVPIIAFWIKNHKGELMDDDAIVNTELRDTVPKFSAASATMALDAATTAEFDGPAELIIAMGLGDQSLFDRLQACRREGLDGIPDEELLRYLEDSAKAIDFLNSPVHDLGSGPAGIQHCDIKPHNLIIVGGSVQVCDFGLARMMGADRATTAAASIAYAAPECLSGNPSHSTDQYCLAVSFFELKTGELPYSDVSMAAVMDAKRRNKLDFSRLPDTVQKVLRRATQCDPAKRYASCSEMVRELRGAIAAAAQAVKRPADRGLKLLAGAMIAVVVVGIAGWFAWEKFGPQPKQHIDSTVIDSKPIDSKPSATLPITSAAPIQPADDPDREAKAYLESGTKSLQSGDFAAAARDLEKASKLGTRDAHSRASIFSRLGNAWLGQQEREKAIASFTKAIEIEPFDGDYVNRGNAYMGLKETDPKDLNKAIDDYLAAVNLKPGNAAAYVALAGAYVDRGDANRAIAAYGAAVNICKNNADANYPEWNVRLLRGNTYLDQEKKAEAADDFAHASRLVPRDDLKSVQSVLESLDGLAAAYAKAGQRAEALKWAKTALDLAPDGPAKQTCRQRVKEYEAGGK